MLQTPLIQCLWVLLVYQLSIMIISYSMMCSHPPPCVHSLEKLDCKNKYIYISFKDTQGQYLVLDFEHACHHITYSVIRNLFLGIFLGDKHNCRHFNRGVRSVGSAICGTPEKQVGVQSLAQGHLEMDGDIGSHRGIKPSSDRLVTRWSLQPHSNPAAPFL